MSDQNNIIQKFLRQIVCAGEPDLFVQLEARHVTAKNKQFVIGRDLKELADWAIRLNRKNYDVYYTTSPYSNLNTNEEHWESKRNIHTIVPRSWVALDFDYKDQSEDRQGIHIVPEIKSITGHSPHMIVESGGGIHAYYRLESADKIVSAHSIARQLFDGNDRPKMDQSKAAQYANSVLRLPFLKNNKRAAPVKIVPTNTKWSSPAIDNFAGEEFESLGTMRVNPTGRLLLQGTPYTGWVNFLQQPMDLDSHNRVQLSSIRRACPAFNQFLKDSEQGFMRNGTLVSNRDDMLTAFSVIKFSVIDDSGEEDTDKHRAYAVGITNNYPNADETTHYQQYDTIKNRIGCSAWSDDYNAVCEECPYRLQEKLYPSPYRAGKLLQREEEKTQAHQLHFDTSMAKLSHSTAQTLLPEPAQFKVRADGVYVEEYDAKSKGTVEMKLTDVGFRFISTGVVGIYNIAIAPSYKEVRTLSIQNTGSPANILSALHACGISIAGSVSVKDAGKGKKYLSFFVEQNISNMKILQEPKLGWKDGEVYLPDRKLTLKNGSLHHTSMCYGEYQPMAEGSVDQWWDAMNSLVFKYPEMTKAAVYVLAAFSAPLLHALDISGENALGGHLINLKGEAGAGKTQLMRMAASVYGSRYNTQATEAFREHNLYHSNHLPVFYDDYLRNWTAAPYSIDPVTELAHEVAEGVSKGKMITVGVAKTVKTSSTNVLTGTNDCMFAAISTKNGNRQQAVEDRMTQIELGQQKKIFMEKYGVDLVQLAGKVSSTTASNQAVVGAEFLGFVMHHKDTFQDWAEEERVRIRAFGFNKTHKVIFWTGIFVTIRILKSMQRLPADFTITVDDLASIDIGGRFQTSGRTKQVEELSEDLLAAGLNPTQDLEELLQGILLLDCTCTGFRELKGIHVDSIADSVQSDMARYGHGWTWTDDQDRKCYLFQCSHLSNALKRLHKSRDIPSARNMVDMLKKDLPDSVDVVNAKSFIAPAAAMSFTQQETKGRMVILRTSA